MKTNKSYTKRLKITRKGKLLARKAGLDHFNAKESGNKQTKRGKFKAFIMPKKAKSHLLPFN
jgi:ribosomal protein L35